MKNKVKKLAAGICILSIFVIFYIYAENAFRVNALGNVGIGVEDATAKLEVNGRIKDKTGYIMPVGSVLPYFGAVETIDQEGWLLCDGREVSRHDYADLFTIIGVCCGAGDGSTTFNLPDLRGMFLRGTDDMGSDAGAAGRDPDSFSRNVGSIQSHAIQGHRHIIRNTHDGNDTSYKKDVDHTRHNEGIALGTLNTGAWGGGYFNIIADAIYSGEHGQVNVTTETRPVNIAVNYIIKY